MKNYILTILILGCSTSIVNSQNTLITIGKIDSLYSKVLHENRRISVFVPEESTQNETYPVIYLFDGDENFEHTVATVKQLSAYGNQFWPKMIIVGISNTDRTRDLTPSHLESAHFGNSLYYKTSGGGTNFMEFMKKELIPYVEKNYPTKPYRTLIGHSYGGLMVINAIVNYTDLFDNFIALDPSLWWGNGNFCTESIKEISQRNFDNKSLYLSASNPEIDNLDLDGLERDTSIYSTHIRAIIKFIKAMLVNKQNELTFDWKYFETENHVSIPLISTYHAMRSTFSWYRFENPYLFFDSLLTADQIVKKVNSHFDLLTEKFGYRVLPPENWINGYGYEFLGEGMYEKAFAFFEMNIRNYPESLNTYDSMADYYIAKKEDSKAIECYEKSLKIKYDANVVQKLKRLRENSH